MRVLASLMLLNGKKLGVEVLSGKIRPEVLGESLHWQPLKSWAAVIMSVDDGQRTSSVPCQGSRAQGRQAQGNQSFQLWLFTAGLGRPRKVGRS